MNELPRSETILELVQASKIDEAQTLIEKLRSTALESRVEVAELTARVRELEHRLEQQGVIEWDGRVYWRRLPGDENRRDGPFCQFCYDKTGRTLRLIAENNGICYCAECGTAYPPTKR